MNAEKYTQKSLEAVKAAQELTIQNQNQQIEQEHLLVLAMHLDGRRERGEFANRGHRAVNRAAATPGDAQATTHDVLVTVDETGLGERLLGTVAHDRSIRTSTAYSARSKPQ